MRRAFGAVPVALACLLSPNLFAGPSFTYDELGRVATARYDNGYQISYTYDAAGNRTQVATQVGGNRGPVAAPDTAAINEGTTSLVINPLANDSDPDGNALTIYSVTGAQYGTATITNSATRITYTPTTTRTAVEKLTYVVTDPSTASAASTVTINLNNLAPIAVPDSINVTRLSATTFDPRSNDTDAGNDPLTITATTQGTRGTVTIINNGTQLTYTSTSTNGSDSFSYTIRDIDGATANGTVSVSVTGVQNPPVAVNDSFTYRITDNGGAVVTDKTIDPRVNDSDPDSDPLTIVAVTQGANGTVTIVGGGTGVNYNFPGCVQDGVTPDAYTYTISDGNGGTATATVNLTVRCTIVQ